MKEKVSALMDGELETMASDSLIGTLKEDEELLEVWSRYHLIGDCMRGVELVDRHLHDEVMQRIRQEPTVLAPKRKVSIKDHPLMSIAASMAAVLVVGWALVQQQNVVGNDQQPPVALAQNANVSAESVSIYLDAHRKIAPDSIAQAAYYMRPVDYSGNAAR